MFKHCLICKKKFKTIPALIKRGGGKFCSWACKSKSQEGVKKSKKTLLKMRKVMLGRFPGPLNPRWKGGKYRHLYGYILAYAPGHPYQVRNYVNEHRLVIEKRIKRFLSPQEIVHHIDGNKSNNRLSNLIAFTSRSAHLRFHKNPFSVNLKEIIFDGSRP